MEMLEFPDDNVSDSIRRKANQHMHRVQSSDERVCYSCREKMDIDLLAPVGRNRYRCRPCSIRVMNSRIPGQGC